MRDPSSKELICGELPLDVGGDCKDTSTRSPSALEKELEKENTQGRAGHFITPKQTHTLIILND